MFDLVLYKNILFLYRMYVMLVLLKLIILWNNNLKKEPFITNFNFLLVAKQIKLLASNVFVYTINLHIKQVLMGTLKTLYTKTVQQNVH